MGLGKTVQAIALLWLLLNQGPYGGRPVIRRCLIVTPGSLMQNWVSEISKWLGRERLPVFCVNQGSSIKSYLTRNSISAPPVIIMSYEMFLQNSHDVYNIPYLDMVICDEGHRLKNATVHTSMALRQIPARRRILLTGTPVQNDLNELWSLADFCAPGCLGSSLRAFRDEWLISSSENKYPPTELLGCESECFQRSQRKISRMLEGFFLRRTAEVLRSDMMSKTESIVFCHPSVLQIQLEAILLRWVRQEFGIDELDERSLDETNCGQQQYESTAQNKTGVRSVLCVITAFRKLCNHPELLRKFIETSSSTVDRLPRQLTADLLRIFNETDVVRAKDYMDDPSLYSSLIECSGKLTVLNHMLRQLFQPATAQAKSNRSTTKHRLVLVSNFTQTLDLLQPICSRITGQSCLRLDGQTSLKRRWDLVQRFNASDSPERILLLSSRAGGMGLNLTGADHLILYDIDWNPANDAQALARIWRPGQSRPVRLYRLITADSLEERMFQRQAAKMALSFNAVVSSFDNKPIGILTKEELRDLFQMPPCNVPSWTHHLIGCTCDSGMVTPRPSLSTDILKSYPTEDHDSESDTRNFQLGASTSTHSGQHSKPMSESLAFLLDWTHSLNYAAILRLKDPLLSPLSDDMLPINAVFSLTTSRLDPPSSIMYSQCLQ
ncbi:hypothetical protein EG68_09768 [Paragonimus skrjabini miyazakii]|uniref:DNA repair and recombination protein RAD54B n=1 Tax=Paragonimus skrjabini miyazakii TaxID=59628 RepID=A0A8S9Y9T0_9TREM|nr:hypothetical protein EG68_09768 [Paragonimus skrjabini miyazakii]